MTSHLLTGFLPIYTSATKLLVLGSFPSVASLHDQQYYAHPRNQFWRIWSDLLGTDLVSLSYPNKVAFLKQHHIGVWDVITQTERKGSLDSDIKNPQASNLLKLLTQIPQLHTIGFNGKTATKIGLQQLGSQAQDYHIVSLPSTSPAYTLSYAEKLTQWKQLLSESGITE